MSDERGWDDDTYVITGAQKHLAIGPRFKLMLGYDEGHTSARLRQLCNASLLDGAVCRMPFRHDGDHVPFAGEVVALTGVFVVARLPRE